MALDLNAILRTKPEILHTNLEQNYYLNSYLCQSDKQNRYVISISSFLVMFLRHRIVCFKNFSKLFEQLTTFLNSKPHVPQKLDFCSKHFLMYPGTLWMLFYA